MDELFSNRKSLLSVDSAAFSNTIGIVDPDVYLRCVADSSGFPRIAAGIAAGDSLQIGGTPTLFLNGWRYDGAISTKHMSEAIDDLLANKPPRHGVSSKRASR